MAFADLDFHLRQAVVDPTVGHVLLAMANAASRLCWSRSSRDGCLVGHYWPDRTATLLRGWPGDLPPGQPAGLG